MKRKSLATLLSGFLTVCLTGVGFASWLITGDGKIDAEGTIKVETVEDRRISIEKDTSKTDDSLVIFGQPSEETIGNQLDNVTPWLRPSSDIQDEDLTAVFNFKIKNAKYAKLEVTAKDSLATFISNKYITMNTTFEYDASKSEETTLKVTLSFGWGEKFDFKNPYIYYNLQEQNDVVINKAITDVNALTLTSFTVELSGTYTAPAA